jgi:hypothetical protein
MRKASFSQIRYDLEWRLVPCRPNRGHNSSGRHPPHVVIIWIKLSSNPRPERVCQLYSGFYRIPDLEQNAELRILFHCSPIPITPKAIQDLLDELEASGQGR